MDLPTPETKSGPPPLTPDIRERFQRHAAAWKEKSHTLAHGANGVA